MGAALTHHVFFRGLLDFVWCPMMANAVMRAQIAYIPDPGFGGHNSTLVRDAAAVAGVLVTMIFFLGFLTRCPDGPKRNVLKFVRQRLHWLLG